MDPGSLDFPLHRRPAESGPGCVLHVNHDSNYEHVEDKIKQDRLFDKVNDSVGVHGVSFTVLIVISFYRSRSFDVFTLTASRMSAFNAASFTVSPSWKSMARTVLPSRRVLKSFFGSFTLAPLGNVSLTAFLSVSATHIIPS